MNETGAILLEAVVRLDYEARSRCADTDSYHRALGYPDENLYDHGICKYCLKAIRMICVYNFFGWISYTHIIKEWP